MAGQAPWDVAPKRPWEVAPKDGAPTPYKDEHPYLHAIAPTVLGVGVPALLAPETMGGSVALSGAGTAAGQAINEGMDRLLGVRKEGQDTDALSTAGRVAGQGALGALSVPVGEKLLAPVVGGAARLAGKIPVYGTGKNVGELAGQAAKALLSRSASIFTGVPKDAAQRLLEMPDAVMSPEEAKLYSDADYQKLAQQARDKFIGTGKARTEAVKEAKAAIDPAKTENTRAMIDNLLSMANEKAPLPSGHGPLSPGAVKELKVIANRDLTTPEFTFEAPHPEALSSTPLEETVQTAPEVRATGVDFTMGPHDAYTGTPPKVVPGKEFVVSPAESKTVRYGYQNQMPVQNKKNLMKLYDWASNEIDKRSYDPNPAQRSSGLSDAILKQLKGKLSKAVANDEPPLQAANKAYSQWADDSDLLKPMGDEEKVQSFLKRISGEGKTPEQDAAKRIVPDELSQQQSMMASDASEATRAKADKSASDAFNPNYAGTGSPWVRRGVGSAFGALSGEELYHDRPGYAAAALAAGALLNPAVAKHGLYNAAKFGENVLPPILSGGVYTGARLSNPWSLLKRKDDSQ